MSAPVAPFVASAAIGGPYHRDYEIVPIVAPNKVLSLDGDSPANGQKVQLWDPVGAAGQRVKIVPTATPGEYVISSSRSGKPLCIEGARHDNGAKIHQWHHCCTPDQVVRMDNLDGRPTSIIAKHSGKCWDVAGGGKDNGTLIHQWDTMPDNPNQKFRILPAGSTGYKFNDQDQFYIRALISGQYFDVQCANDAAGTAVQQWELAGAANQKFRLRQVGQDLYTIQATYCNHVLEFPNGGVGDVMRLGELNNRGTEVFHIAAVNGFPTQIISQQTGLAVEVQNSSKSNGAPIVLGNKAMAQLNQIFVLERVIPGF